MSNLIIILCDFQDWSLRYNPEEPVAPRYDVNAPDLYIPGEAYHLSLPSLKKIRTISMKIKIYLLYFDVLVHYSVIAKYSDIVEHCRYRLKLRLFLCRCTSLK